MNPTSKTKNPRKTITRKPLATFCFLTLIVSTSAAISADRMGPQSGWQDGSRIAGPLSSPGDAARSTAKGIEYPDVETMLQMYHAARKNGTLDNSMSTEYPTLPILKSAYRLLTEPGADKSKLQGEALNLQTSDMLVPTKAVSACRAATLECIKASASQAYSFATDDYLDPVWTRTFICAIAAAGRNQDSPKISSDCTNLFEGAEICAAANDVCGVVSQGPIEASSFWGSTTNYPNTFTCGTLTNGVPKDRAIKLGVRWSPINGVNRITAMYMKCSSISSGWVGYLQANSASAFSNCPNQTSNKPAIEGAKITKLSSGGLRSLKLRCDDVTSSASTGDYYAASIGDTGGTGTEGRVECPEGYYVWGIRVYTNDSAPASQRYITGYSYLCRK